MMPGADGRAGDVAGSPWKLRHELLDALGFLTVVPVTRPADSRSRGGTRAFPVVGLAVGVLPFAALCLPVPAPARAALATALQVAVTGGLHEDAWADVADGAFAVAPPSRRLEILADPRVGAHGLTATVVLLLLRWSAFVSVPPAAALASPVIGRWAMVVAARLFPPARDTGLGAWFAGAARPVGASLAAAGCLALVALMADPGRILAAWGVGAAVGWVAGRFLEARFSGLNGDGYGAVGVAAELAALWAFLPWGG